jgi:hypothetical protein
MHRYLSGIRKPHLTFSLFAVIIGLVTLADSGALADPPDTIDLQLQWSCPLVVRDMKLVDLDGDRINELLVGFNSDSARVGILDIATQTWRWQSSAFDGTIYTVTAGDRNNDGYMDVLCGGQRSDSSIGYIEVFDGPALAFAHKASGFDQIVLSAAIYTCRSDSLPKIFLGSYYDKTHCSPAYPYLCVEHKSGHLHRLDGESLAAEGVTENGAVREMLIRDTNGDSYEELLLGMDYYQSSWSQSPTDFTYMHSWVKVLSCDSSRIFNLSTVAEQGTWFDILFEALDVASFNGGVSKSIVAGDWYYWYTNCFTTLACWNAFGIQQEWSIDWNCQGLRELKDLAVCGYNSTGTNAICAVYRSGLMEFISGADGSLLAVSPRTHSIYHLELGNVDQDNLAEICVASANSLYVYESPWVTTDVDETEHHSLMQDFSLFQNYPNPFNPETRIRFSLPFPCEASISIHNILGEQVRVFRRSYQAGTHTLTWDGKNSSGQDVASGVYFCRLEAGRHQDTKKMLLIR